MRMMDLSGPIYPGMWTYGEPYPEVEVTALPEPEWVPYPTYSWRLQLSAQTGTYLENERHMRLDGPPLEDVPVEELVLRPAAVLRTSKAAGERLEVRELEGAAEGLELEPGLALLVATGWGARWEQPDFVAASPYFSREAMRWLLDLEPFLIGADLPRFDSGTDPQLFFAEFFDRGVLLLAPLVNLERVPVRRGRLIALPIRVRETAAAPCRAVFCWEDKDQ